MNEVSRYIVELLNDDMVSHGLLAQCVNRGQANSSDSELTWQDVLKDVLAADVEIGNTRLCSPDYVEFVAWKGTVDDRIARAITSVSNSAPAEREFAYWLTLRKNVDRYE